MLDSSVYLASYGWKGKGNGLRQGSASRPLSIPQKRTLAGLGKDRDEAFPFWDHLFAAAAKSIQIKVLGDEAGAEGGSETQASLLRTATGILSNRRPVDGTPATSGTATPSDLGLQNAIPRLSLMAIAKRDSARKRLYSSFFRGPTLGPDKVQDQAAVSKHTTQMVEDMQQNDNVQFGMKQDEQGQRKFSKEKKKRKRKDDGIVPEKGNNNQKKKKRGLHTGGGLATALTQNAREYEEQLNPNVERDVNGQHVIPEDGSKNKAGKAERKKLKEERRNRREERRKRREERNKRREEF